MFKFFGNCVFHKWAYPTRTEKRSCLGETYTREVPDYQARMCTECQKCEVKYTDYFAEQIYWANANEEESKIIQKRVMKETD